jgi:type I restriction enzyme S subunit
MNKFSSYQDTNIPWIGEIPTGWSLKSLKHIFTEKKSTKNSDLGCGSISFGKVIYKDDEKIPESTKESYQEVLDGEFLINPLNLNYDLRSLRIGLSRINVVVSQGYIVLNIRDGFIPEYYEYLLRKFDVEHMKSLGQGVRQTISYTHLKDEKLVVPPVEEQLRISRYLDKKTIQIDSLVNKIEKKIELLKEQRTSLLNHYVTKGLDPNVGMKDSGIEWIGEIPKHWNVSKFKFYFEFGMGQTILKENLTADGYPVLSATEKYELLGYFDSPSFILEVDDLVIPARGNSIGFVKLVKEPSVSTQTTIYGKRKFPVSSNFVRYFCEGYKPYLFHFDQTAIPQITVDQVKNNILLIPSEKEQITISNELDKRCDALELLISKLQKRRDLMNEYRQSLISSVVTGKVRVAEDMI